MAINAAMSSFFVLLGIGFLCAANAIGDIDESASTDDLNEMYSQPDKVIRDVYVVNKTPLNDPDYTEFVHTMLKAKLDSDGHVFVKVADEELQIITDTEDLDKIHLFGHAENIFFDIADVLLTEDVRSNVALLTRNMDADEDGADTVAALVHTRGARIDVFTMESQSIQRGARTRRQAVANGFSVFQQIAQATGGMVIHTTKNNIGSVVNLLKQAIKSNVVDILRFNFPGRNAGKHFNIPVDDTMTQMTMLIQTPNARPIVMITMPTGLPLPPTAGQFLGNSLELFEINMTKTTDYGQWKVLKAGGSDWDVKVTGQSPVDVSVDFMEPGPGGIGMYPIKGRPIAGQTYQLNIKVSGYDMIKSVNIVLFLDSLNNPTGPPQMLHSVGGRRGKSLFTTNITIPTLDFKVAMDGMDKNNHIVRRLSPILVSPISIDLIVPPIDNGTLYVNGTLRILFTVFNEANTKQDVLVKIQDSKGFAQSPHILLYTLNGGENHTSFFIIKGGPTIAVTDTVIITAKPYIKGQVTQGQFVIRRFTVQENTTTTTTTATSAAPPTTTVSSSSPTTTTTPTTSAAPPTTTVPASSSAPTTGQTQMTQKIPTQSTTPACKTGTGSSSGNQAPAGLASSNVGKKVPSNPAGSKPNITGSHGYLHLLLKYMDTDFEVEVAN